uniref:Uncharacterized protein n=1 Tax=Arundo donax TaxID=35708 RepID=A0A0A8ZC10_ARUDO
MKKKSTLSLYLCYSLFTGGHYQCRIKILHVIKKVLFPSIYTSSFGFMSHCTHLSSIYLVLFSE